MNTVTRRGCLTVSGPGTAIEGVSAAAGLFFRAGLLFRRFFFPGLASVAPAGSSAADSSTVSGSVLETAK